MNGISALSNLLPSWDFDPMTMFVGAIVGCLALYYYACDLKEHNVYSTSYSSSRLLNNKHTTMKASEVDGIVGDYENLFDGSRTDVGKNTTAQSIENRQKEYSTMVNSFYNLVTDFYEYGWGQSFHFAPRFRDETFQESIKRAEHHLASRLGLSRKSKVLDIGCGVGGPARNISQFAGCEVQGVTINDYQVSVGNNYCAEKGLGNRVTLRQGDFQKLSEMFPSNTFDAAYQIEATCHSPDKTVTFKGIHKVLKKGGLFAGYEWCVLPERGYDEKNVDHVRIKEGIEVGNGLPTLATPQEVVDCLEEAGFEVIEHYDANENQHSKEELPWYYTLQGQYKSVQGFRMTTVGRNCTHIMVRILELLRIAPKGSVRVSALLNATALDLVEGGQKELFTPSYYFLARKR